MIEFISPNKMVVSVHTHVVGDNWLTGDGRSPHAPQTTWQGDGVLASNKIGRIEIEMFPHDLTKGVDVRAS